MKVDMKGIGLEEVFTVQKRRVQQSKLIGQGRIIRNKNQTKEKDNHDSAPHDKKAT